MGGVNMGGRGPMAGANMAGGANMMGGGTMGGCNMNNCNVGSSTGGYHMGACQMRGGTTSGCNMGSGNQGAGFMGGCNASGDAGGIANLIEQLQNNPAMMQTVLQNPQLMQQLIVQAEQAGIAANVVLNLLKNGANAESQAGMGTGGMGNSSFCGMHNTAASCGVAAGLTAVGAPASVGAEGALSRAIYMRNVHPNTSYEDLVNEVGVYGPLESIRFDAQGGECFVNFLDPQSAAALLQARHTPSLSECPSALYHWLVHAAHAVLLVLLPMLLTSLACLFDRFSH